MRNYWLVGLVCCCVSTLQAQFVRNSGLATINTANVTVNGDWDNQAGSITNNGTITLSDDWTSVSGYSQAGIGGFVLTNVVTKQFNHGGQYVGFLTKNGAGTTQVNNHLLVKDSLLLIDGVLAMTGVNDTLIMLAGVLATGTPTSYVTGRITRYGGGDLFFPSSRASNYLPITLSQVTGSNPRVTVSVEDKPGGYVAGQNVTALTSFPYVWRSEVLRADTATNVEVQYPTSLASPAATIVSRSVAGSMYAGMGMQTTTTAAGVTKIKSYLWGLRGLFSVAVGPSLALDAPVATAASAVSQLGFTANWSTVVGAIGYQLDISSDNFITFLPGYSSKAVVNTSEVVIGLTSTTTYSYRVRATDASGASVNSNVIDVTTLLPQMPAPVASPATEVTQSGFTANWAAADGATGYQLDVSMDNFATFASGYNGLSVSVTSAPVTGLAASTTYKYRVRATGAQPVSVNSNVIDVTTLVAQMLPPTATTATAVAPTSFIANWTSIGGASGYELDVSMDNFATFIGDFNSVSVEGTSAAVMELAADTEYQYRVRAVGSLPVSENSNVVGVTTLQKTAQSITFPAISDKTIGDDPFPVGATASSGLIVSYAIASTHITIAGGQATLVSAGRETIEASQPGDGSFNAATTVTQSFCINPAKPTVTTTGANTETAILTSSASTGNQWYKDDELIPGATNATLSVTAVGIYQVQVKVDDCVSAFSSDAPIIVTGISLELSSALILFPNPAKDKVYVDLRGFEAGKSVQLKITDLLGRGIHKQDSEGGALVEIDVVSYASGAYLVTLIQEAKSAQLRFVKEE